MHVTILLLKEGLFVAMEPYLISLLISLILKDAYIHSCNISGEIKLKRLFNSKNIKILFMLQNF